MEHGLLALVAQSGAGHPARGHVDHAQRVQERAGTTPATVGDQVHLEEPGRASVQSANVRMAIWRLSSVPALVVLMPRRALVCSRNGLSARSTVAALKRATR